MRKPIIEGRYTVVGETPVKPRRRLHPAFRYVLTRPIFWIWVVLISFVGLTEGWY